MKVRYTHFTGLLLIFLFFFFVSADAQVIMPQASNSCVSNDLQVVRATVTGGDPCNACVDGTPLTKTLTLSINNKTGSARTFGFWATVEIYSGVDGSLISSSTRSGCAGPIADGITSQDFGTISYKCGDIIKLIDVWEAWTSASGSCPLDPNSISPKCGKVASLTVNTGVNGTLLAVDSDYDKATGSINLTPRGGTAPYTYLWTTVDGSNLGGQETNEDLTNLKPGTYKVTITDAAGCSMSKSVTVNAIYPPLNITCPAPLATKTNSGCTAANVVLSPPTAAENCGIESITNDHPSSTFPIGTTTVKWTVTDKCGHTATCTQEVTVTDEQKPVITACAAPVNVKADNGACGASNVKLGSGPVATDNCSGPSQLNISNNAPSVFPVGKTIVTWTVVDAAGNKETCLQEVTVTDDQKPIISVCPAPINVKADNGVCTASNVNLGAPPVANDNCGLSSELIISNNAPKIFPIGTTTVIWTVKDVAGNIASCTQQVIVTDDQKPIITACAAPINVKADSGACTASNVNLGAKPVATDNCGLTSELIISNNAPKTFPIGTTTVTWTVKDAAGNTETCTQLVTVTDGQKPTITACASSINVNADNGACTASNVNLGAGPVATDNCGLSSQLDISNNAPSVFPIGKTIVTWTIKDAAGNTTTCEQIVTVKDNQKPLITACAISVDVKADNGACTASNVNLGAQPVVTDNCNISSDLIISNNAPLVFPIGITTVIWTVKDAAGNIATCQQKVTVTDDQKPIITTCAAPVNVKADNGACTASNVNLGTGPVATDNCGMSSALTFTNDAPATFPIGTTTVTWTVKDAAGNTQTCTQQVIVTDDQKPVIAACAAAVNVKADYGVCTVSNVNLGSGPVVSDNCGLSSELKINNNAPVIFPKGLTVVTWTIEDAAGNKSTCEQNVTVIDDQKPIVSHASLADVIGQCFATVSTPPTASDNCAGTVKATTTDPLTYTEQGTFVVHWTFDDGNGNITSANQNVIVDNTIPPPAPALADVTGECSATASVIPTMVNNCYPDKIITATTQDPLTYTELGTHVIHWAFDIDGNIVTSNQNVIVYDLTPPVFIMSEIPADVTIECSAIPVAPVDIAATDNCDTNPKVTFSEQKVDGYCPGNYTLIRTWTVTDVSGNSSSQSQKITVRDITPPTISGTFQNIVDITCDQIPEIPQLEFTDNCSGIAEIIAPTADDNVINKTDESYTILRNWKVTDLCGNTSNFVQTINVTITDAVTNSSVDACNAKTDLVDLNEQVGAFAGLGTWKDVSSSGGLKGNNDGIFSPFGIPLGSYTMEYDVDDPTCPRKFLIAVDVNDKCKVLECGNIVVHNFFSPNNDGYNDVFTIENIDDFTCYPTNKVRIYNRWGALLYETQGYDNNERAFRGISDAGATVNQNAELPSGTYFYLLEYTSDSKKEYKESGYLYLSR